MKKRYINILIGALVACLGLGGCSQAANISSDGADESVVSSTQSQTETSSSSSESAASNSTSGEDYAEGSLRVYHNSIGADISAITEVSAEECGACHGDWATIQSETDAVLQQGSSSANPHLNHMSEQLACGDCHKLDERSSLPCKACHDWTITRDNGTWQTS